MHYWGVSVHTYTITDNDNAPVVDFNTTKLNGAESVSSKAITVDLSAASAQNVTVNYAITGTATGSGTDYTLANGTLTINAGATSGTITIAGIVDDSLDEANETVVVTLSSPSNATLGTDSVHTYTITDNDNAPVVDFNTTSSSGAESVSSKDIGGFIGSYSTRCNSQLYGNWNCDRFRHRLHSCQWNPDYKCRCNFWNYHNSWNC